MYVGDHVEWCFFIYVLFYIQIIYLFEFYLWFGGSDSAIDLRIIVFIYFSLSIWRLIKLTEIGAYFIVNHLF